MCYRTQLNSTIKEIEKAFDSSFIEPEAFSPQEEINALLVERCRAGQIVTRLQFQDLAKQRFEHVIDGMMLMKSGLEDLESATGPVISSPQPDQSEWLTGLLSGLQVGATRQRFLRSLAQFTVACAFAVRTMRVTFDQISPREFLLEILRNYGFNLSDDDKTEEHESEVASLGGFEATPAPAAHHAAVRRWRRSCSTSRVHSRAPASRTSSFVHC